MIFRCKCTRFQKACARDLLVEVLREQVHLVRLVLAGVALLPELELRERLVRERAGPH